MSKHLKKEKQICEDNEFINYKYGTINVNNPVVIYLFGGSWISPKVEKDNYDYEIKKLSSLIKKASSAEISKIKDISNDYIIDIDIRNSGISYNAKRFMKFEINFVQKNKREVGSNELECNVTKIINGITDKLANNPFFQMQSKK